MTNGPTSSVVVVAGASGFVGQQLGDQLSPRFSAIGLSRKARPGARGYREFRSADLFSFSDTRAALEGARFAVYLVHSMIPSAHLTQASFQDLDLLCADNFALAAKHHGLEQIVYLGGILPTDRGDLSAHLKSRQEVERVLASHGVPVTTLRAALVIGPGGSSFEIVDRLVKRLPAMVTPRWTATRSQPVALEDVVALLAFAVGREETYGQTYDVGGGEILSYRALMAMAATARGVKRAMVAVPLLTPRLSRLWVSLVTGAPKALIAPLIESLEHEMVARDDRLFRLALRTPEKLADTIARAVKAPRADKPHAYQAAHSKGPQLVRSVQRMRVPAGKDAAWAMEEYLRFLPKLFRGGIRVELTDGPGCRFTFAGKDLLVLKHDESQRDKDRQLLWITGGALATSNDRGRLEFRLLPDGRTLLTAIHEFQPRLPWPLYKLTQAQVHLQVMHAFRRHLARLEPAQLNGS